MGRYDHAKGALGSIARGFPSFFAKAPEHWPELPDCAAVFSEYLPIHGTRVG
jgi:hypothetical protein